MNRISRWLGACIIVLALDSSAIAQLDETNAASATVPAWPVSTAPARFTIEPDHAEAPAPMSWTNLYLPEPNWESSPIRVFTEAGVAVGSDVLWSAPGEPVTLVFDSSSGAKSYSVYVGSSWPAMHLADSRAGVWVETRPGDGQVIKTLPDMLAAWNKNTTVNGRAIAEGIFEGGHRFGPQGNLLTHLRGWFTADQPEHLAFAPVSVDSSFVLVDGKEVVRMARRPRLGLWPRWAAARPGRCRGGPPCGRLLQCLPPARRRTPTRALLPECEGRPVRGLDHAHARQAVLPPRDARSCHRL